MADGEVTYEIRGDDSNLDRDLDAAQKKVEQSTKQGANKTEQIEKDTSQSVKKTKEDVTRHHKQENDKRVKDDEQSGKQRENNEKSVSGKIKDIISDTANQNPVISKVTEVTGSLGGAAGAWLGVGAAAAAVGGIAINSATQMDQAMNQFISSTGKGTEETERYQGVLENIYKNNYGEDFQDIAGAMENVTKQLGDMSDDKLQEVTESAFALRDTFEYDIPESTRAAKAMMDNFGTSGEDAMSLIAAGAQNGLDYSGELIDSISEYSTQFAKLGFNADDMFKIFQKGADSGAFNLDKVGDAVKEFSIRAIDGSDSTVEGFTKIGLNADEMAKKFSEGGDSAKEAFQETIEALAGMEDPLEQNIAGTDLFGTMWEDLGPEAVSALADIKDGAYDTADAMNGIKDVKYDDLGSVMDGLKRSLELLLVPLGQALIPILTMLAQSVLPLITGVLQPIMDLLVAILEPILQLIQAALQPLIEVITLLINTAMQPLMGVLNLLLSSFQEVMNGISDNVKDQIGNVTKIFDNLIDFVKNVFTGNWKGAWENVKTILKTVADSFKGIIKTPINAMIDLINGFIKGLSNIKIPDWVPGIGGKGFNIPTIPRLKTGIDFIPGDYFPAYLDYGERVLTQEENVRFNAMGGLTGMEATLSQGNYGQDQKIVLGKGCIVVQSNVDGKTIAETTAPYMDTELGNVTDTEGRSK